MRDPAQDHRVATSHELVSLQGVTKSYGPKTALRGISFDIPAGQVCGLLGPNGAGKTTLFRLLMGILKATAGSLRVDGLDAFEDRVAVKRLIGFLPDEPVFYSYLSGRETLALSAAMHGLDAQATLARLQPMIARLRLAEDLDRFAEDYSRGMKKKLGLLLAMLHEPKLLVLDEPTNGLDVESTHLFYDLILDVASNGTTILFSTHLLDHVTRLCSHVVIINAGEVVTKGALTALRAENGGAALEDIFPETDIAARPGVSALPAPPGYWHVVWLLLAASFRRAMGRRRRQRDLFRQRAAKRTDFSRLGFVLGAALLALVHVLAAFTVAGAVAAGEQVAAERRGSVVADQWFIDRILHPEGLHSRSGIALDPRRVMDRAYHAEAAQIAQRDGGDPDAIEARLRQTVADRGAAGLIARSNPVPGLRALPLAGSLPAMLGSLTLLTWFVMMAFQGEGLELDVQRRRHPMWEWLFSHPVPQGAVFLADMLSPLAANPVYFTAPLLPGLLFGFVYGKTAGIVAAAVVGTPVTVAASCLGKALEVAVTLRFGLRSRGAMIGLMGWLGYATMLGLVLASVSKGRVFAAIAGMLSPMAALPWPYLGWFLGLRPDGTFSLPSGMIADVLLCALAVAGSVWFSVWGAARGLAGESGGGAPSVAPTSRRSAQFRGDALYRKEILWFARDRSALVQAVLIPLSLAAFQAFNMRRLVAQAGHQWNTLCGAAVVFGTYFLLVLGPKSLASEGAALWISLTWPHGLEKLLRAKARLWAALATGIVGLVLIYAAMRFPADAWRIALLGVAWFLFARSMAAKTVTLATVTSESGEIQKVPMGRRWAAQLGLLTFSIGVFSQQWNLVVMGVVYSGLTAAAMWQNFRARLPTLYDPWSEVLPAPPTLMHAMIGISVLVEAGAVITGGMLVFVARSQVAVAYGVIYGLCAAGVSIGMVAFLSGRDVPQRDIWNWRDTARERRVGHVWRSIEQSGRKGLVASLMLGAAIGGALGALGRIYVAALRHLPSATDQMQQSLALMQSIPHLRESFFVMAVLIAPFAEEFLFRGLLYRALDHEWGGWRAVLGSAAFFAVYHPLPSWPPVFLLGAVNAFLFKKTGRLAPAVVLHMVYNGVVLA